MNVIFCGPSGAVCFCSKIRVGGENVANCLQQAFVLPVPVSVLYIMCPVNETGIYTSSDSVCNSANSHS